MALIQSQFLLVLVITFHVSPLLAQSQSIKDVELFSCAAAAPSSIWKPSLIFYAVPLFILALVMNKTISGNIRMIYDQ
ncbi:hypothetical protein GCK32_022460 [Trichostrongylus colubriformis]|uniref:Uncharacterized protein n=1 Tax=Trichostrongylus colubriformis TaxID=6319 RepID=A0AAN8FNL7_TRICO